MPNTYSQVYVQIVFAVNGRQNILPAKHREEIHKYITGITQNRNHKLLAIFCMPDHIHMLIGQNPSQSISDMVRDIKSGSSKFINDKKWIKGKFNWQEGYGAFSYSRSSLDNVIQYILNQEEHHKTTSFKEEYLAFLEKSGLNMMNGICSIGLIDRPPLRGSNFNHPPLFYKQKAPTGQSSCIRPCKGQLFVVKQVIASCKLHRSDLLNTTQPLSALKNFSSAIMM